MKKYSKIVLAALTVCTCAAGFSAVSTVGAADVTGNGLSVTGQGGTFETSRNMDFDKNGLVVSGTDIMGSSGKTTTVTDGGIRVSNSKYATEHYTDIDGGTVRTEILKVTPDTNSSLKFDKDGLTGNVGDTAVSVDKTNGVKMSVDSGNSGAEFNYVKVQKDATVFRSGAHGVEAATETTIHGNKITAGDVVIDGKAGGATITGLKDIAVDSADFGMTGRAATEKQLKTVDSKVDGVAGKVTALDGKVTAVDNKVNIVDNRVTAVDNKVDALGGTVGVLDGRVGTLDTRVAVLNTHASSVDAQIGSLNTRIDGVTGRVNQLDNKINKVGAGAAALAALHPLDYDPAYKWDFAAGMGNYRDANAVALGAFYRPNEVTMISLGASMGNGSGMVNAGVSLKLGSSANGGTARLRLMAQVQDLIAENNALKARDDAQDALINQLRQELEALKGEVRK